MMIRTISTSRAPLARRRMLGFAGALFAGGASLALTGCGGGGDDGGPDGAGSEGDPVGGGAGGGTGGSGGPLSAENRHATFAAVSAKRSEWRSSMDDLALAQALAGYMATLPAYAEAGFDAETLTAWGRMVDGRAHVVVLDRSLLAGSSKGAASATSRLQAQAAAVELPGASTARLMHAFGKNFEGQRTVEEIGGMLSDAGWTIKPQAEGDASLATLRAIQGDGFLYIHTHGGNWGRVDTDLSWPARSFEETPKLYAITSSTRVTTASEADPQTAADLDNWRLVYMDADMAEENILGQSTSELVYGITGGFVQKYWRFAPHAAVVINACNSVRLLGNWSRTFYSEVLLAGADTYFGWTNSVTRQGAYRSPSYVVDRLLGANEVLPESPKQRAFGVDLVMADLVRRGLDHDPGNPASNAARFTTRTRGGETDSHVLAPTIHHCEALDAADELVLYGGFGSTPGRVFVGGQETAVKEWTKTQIRAVLDREGPRSQGEVKVTAGDRSSNVRMLSVVSVPIALQLRDQFRPDLAVRGSGVLEFRVDVGLSREKPGERPVERVVLASATRRSFVALTAAGTTTVTCDRGITWSGTERFVTAYPATVAELPPHTVQAFLKLDMRTQTGGVFLAFGLAPATRDAFLEASGCSGNNRFGPLMEAFEGPMVIGSTPAGDITVDAIRLSVSPIGATQARTFVREGMTVTFSSSVGAPLPTGSEAV